jgi:hypothetical protein
MKLKPNVAVSESGFVFNPLSGESFSVNQSGAFIMNLLKDRTPPEEILQAMNGHFQNDETAHEKDLFDFLRQLGDYNLLDNHDAPKV